MENIMCGRKLSHEELTWAEYRDQLVTAQPPHNSNRNNRPELLEPVTV
jgi:hypothetical protein